MIQEINELSRSQAKEQVIQSYRKIRSEPIRALFSTLIRAYFHPKAGYVRKSVFIGVCLLTRKDLERARLFGEKMNIRGLGVLVLDPKISPALAVETIESISLVGFISASAMVQTALINQFRAGIHINR